MPTISKEELQKQDEQLGVCPICGAKLFRMWGDMWDWDRAVCPARGCDYDRELKTMTCNEIDGSIVQFIDDEEEE